MSFSSSSGGPPSEETPQATPSKKQMSAPPATPAVTPASILKTSTRTGSSKKKLMRELLDLLSEPRKELWRSSPGLYASESENEKEESPGPMKRAKRGLSWSWVSDPGTPPSNEEIYAMLKELDNKEEP
nr:MAG: ORF3 [Torque teno polar bear virus 8]